MHQEEQMTRTPRGRQSRGEATGKRSWSNKVRAAAAEGRKGPRSPTLRRFPRNSPSLTVVYMCPGHLGPVQDNVESSGTTSGSRGKRRVNRGHFGAAPVVVGAEPRSCLRAPYPPQGWAWTPTSGRARWLPGSQAPAAPPLVSPPIGQVP
uniref:39S ribosomal protein L41, mitochondrial isoform X1 n=1 Tax=Urocitellus parryii TaxID=9999 RepID=UPI000E55CB79|nr:39S ribosomal protein L41, mitochondrial isoform X1 [Urocitellus parryii]